MDLGGGLTPSHRTEGEGQIPPHDREHRSRKGARRGLQGFDDLFAQHDRPGQVSLPVANHREQGLRVLVIEATRLEPFQVRDQGLDQGLGLEQTTERE